MKLLGLIDRIDEMAFKRRAIIDKLRALQPSINEHALKILVFPDAEEIPHWKRELIAWGNDLAAMQLRSFRGVTPMGFALAWNGLYREPFEGAEDRVLAFQLGRIEREYQRPITADRRQILIRLTDFLRSYCEAIGKSEFVDPIVNSLGQPVRLAETAAE
jgi:hypothetical protein